MSTHNHNNHAPTALELYEGDQSALYSRVLAHPHSEQSDDSKKQVKRIWMITFWLAVITIIEVGVGLAAHFQGWHSSILSAFFLIATILKAGLIVRVFMHLGDENKSFVYFVLIPMSLYIWVVISFLMDGAHWLNMNFTFAHSIIDAFKK